MTIGQLARRAKVTIRTIRYYEEKGILKPATTTAGGQNLYDAAALLTFRRTKLLQEAGMSLEEIGKTLQSLSQYPTAAKARQQAHAKLLNHARQKILERMQQLQNLKTALDTALEQKAKCEACGASDCHGCSVLDTWIRFAFESPG